MTPKPTRAVGYNRGHVDHVRATCLYVATKLGDLIEDTVVVGGLVPSLLIDQRAIQSVVSGNRVSLRRQPAFGSNPSNVRVASARVLHRFAFRAGARRRRRRSSVSQ